MTDEATGLQYKLAPGPQDLVEWIIPYVPELHAHLWTYVTLHGITYTNQSNLEDWDENICVWNEDVMGQWPFQNPLPEEEMLKREVFVCLEDLDFYMENEETLMDIEQAALDDEFDDDDDDDDSNDEDESDDEGYVTNEEGEEEDNVNFGIAALLFRIEI